MEVPMEIAFRDVARTPEIDRLIQDKAAQLERVCNTLTSCRLAVEQPQEHQQSGNPFRVRIVLRFPPGQELVIENSPGDKPMHESLHAVITDTFDSAVRRLRKRVEYLQDRRRSS